MKSLTCVAGSVLLLALVTGCSTIDPMTLKQTGRDLQSFTETLERPALKEKIKLAVVSKVGAHERAKTRHTGKLTDEAKNDLFLAEKTEEAVAEKFTGLGWFDTVDRKHGVDIETESLISGAKTGPAKAQYALVAESTVQYIAKQGWKVTKDADKSRGVQVSTMFRIIDLGSKQPVLVKKAISSVSAEKGHAREAIEEAARLNAIKFARLVSARFLPDVKVIQTRGDGKYAQVGFGKNYQAIPEKASWKFFLFIPYWYSVDLPGTSVDFCYNEKTGANKVEPVVFAHGRVIRADRSKAWVEIDNADKVTVLKGHNAKVSEEDDGEKPLD